MLPHTRNRANEYRKLSKSQKGGVAHGATPCVLLFVRNRSLLFVHGLGRLDGLLLRSRRSILVADKVESKGPPALGNGA